MKNKTEYIVSLTAMVTAVVAVFVAILQTNVMKEESAAEREHMRLSVTPSMWMSRSILDRGQENFSTYSYEFKNQGLGPAIVEKFTIEYDGKYAVDWYDLFSKVSSDIDGEDKIKGRLFPANTSSVSPGHVIPAGEAVTPLQLNNDLEIITLLLKGNDKLKISLCYCSFYNDCWNVSGLNTRPEPVKMCKSEAPDFNSSSLRVSAG
ncbi:hypothetical protein [Kordiimonas sp. SCSIO 12610]|uniref:hypothetical protein n=1 Tax=Kordiimonas sp. SCSIO 12610 TaxID=2829597 RepID=UPI00210DDB0C|nr:hypothetical protein [Kordiimonas sp. SCSIO 12610]UTW56754.1 hypothetical protein KFF44_07660 [Kordiimonas sp. SCSIO 12610]